MWKVFRFFYKNTLLWEAFNQNACQGPENTTRCSDSRVILWALVALTGLTWSPHQTICPFRLCLQSQPGLRRYLSAVLVPWCLDFLAWPWTCRVTLLDAHWGGPVAVTILLCSSVSGAGGLCLVAEVTAHLVLSPGLPQVVAPLLLHPNNAVILKKLFPVKQVELCCNQQACQWKHQRVVFSLNWGRQWTCNLRVKSARTNYQSCDLCSPFETWL